MRTVLVALLLAACDRGHPRDESSTPKPAPAPAPPAPPPSAAACTLAPLPLRLPAPKRLVAIGDLHGDLGGMRAALRAAGAIDAHDHWSGGDLVIVQTGDVLDRGDDEQAMIDLTLRLEDEAKAAGGALIMLLGNHELMNGAGDFRYVTPGGFRDFDDVPNLDMSKAKDAPSEMKSRVAALSPGGVYAKLLARHAVIAIVGDTVFSHAGVLPDWVSHVDEVNQSARCWLDGQTADKPTALTSDESPVWTRAYGMPEADCAHLGAALDALHAKRMVVGHTVQDRGITSACDDRLWRIDVGLAKKYGGPIEVLEMRSEAPPKVLHGTR